MNQLPDLRGERERVGDLVPRIKTIPERSTIDDLNLHYFISLFAAWNAIDTFFVFVIVLISHPAWAPGSACDRVLWSTQRDSEPVNMKHGHRGKPRFFHLCHFSPCPLCLRVRALLLARRKKSSPSPLPFKRGEGHGKAARIFPGDCSIKAGIAMYHCCSQTKNEALPILIGLFMSRVFSN